MEEYTNAEMANMVYVYGLADGNCSEARRLYAERFPNSRTPNHQTFRNIFQRLSESGTFSKRLRIGRPMAIRTPEIEEAVLNAIEDEPSTSVRKISANLGVNRDLVWTILKDQQLYPYHIQRVQALLPQDYPPRVMFCQWMLQKIAQNPQFIADVLFTDEASFSRDPIMNFHNNHIWSEENPHAVTEARFQQQFSLNVWVGIFRDSLIGPHFLPKRLDGNAYLNFLQNVLLPDLLEDVPLVLRERMWFMHDGAPPHFCVAVRQFLNERFNNKWIGRGALPNQAWPARSPDLNPLDFFFWGHLKSIVYSVPIQNEEHLRERIISGCEYIRNMPGIFENVRQSMRRRCDACIMTTGGHFEQLL